MIIYVRIEGNMKIENGEWWHWMKDNATIKSNKYRFIYDSYDNNIIYTTTNNIVIKYYERKKRNRIDKVIQEWI